eukprot:Hpha_TRINITY_DN18028_c0_g1::TRINITY_DN18028_c0_g1_i1::g.1163::m.1163
MPRPALGRPTAALLMNMGDKGANSGWFEPPPPKKHPSYSQTKYYIPGAPPGLGDENPYWMDGALTGQLKYQRRGPSVKTLSETLGWEGDESKGIPKMPAVNAYGLPLIPRDEAAKFLPDIYIDGLADEVLGPLRTLAKHIVPHQFKQYYDESIVPEVGPEMYLGTGQDMTRAMTWRRNFQLYLNRHPMADEMQRKMMVGDERAQQLWQDPDDTEYEAEIMDFLHKGDLDKACEVYKRLADPPRNWYIYTHFIKSFASRGLIADAVAVWDEMDVLGVPPCGDTFEALVDCAIAAEKPLRVTWAVGLMRQEWLQPASPDLKNRVMLKALRYLCASGEGEGAATVWRALWKDGVQDADNVAEEGAVLAARARALGLLPDEVPSDSSPPYHHLYATTLGGTAADERPEGLKDGEKVDAGAVAASRSALAAGVAAQAPELSDPALAHIDPAPMLRNGWGIQEVVKATQLLAKHVAPEDSLLCGLPSASELEMPYFRKAKQELAINSRVVIPFNYSPDVTALERGDMLDAVHIPSSRKKSLSARYTANDAENPPAAPAHLRYTFRWHDSSTKFAHGSSPDLWFEDLEQTFRIRKERASKVEATDSDLDTIVGTVA